MAEKLREQLIGAWKLVSYQDIPVAFDPSSPWASTAGPTIYTRTATCRPSSPRRTVPIRLRGLVRRPPTITPRKRPPTSPTRTVPRRRGKANPDSLNFVSLFPNWTGQPTAR